MNFTWSKPMIAISENTWSFDYFWHCWLVGLLKQRIIEPSLTAFIGLHFLSLAIHWFGTITKTIIHLNIVT